MKKNNMFLFGSVILIILAIPLVSLVSKSGSSTSGDVRARAAVVKTLQMNGTVNNIDEAKGIVVLDNVYLADESRSGDAKSMGTWTVTPPTNFNFASLLPGQSIVMNIDSKTFLATSHTVTALTITPVN